MIKKNRKKGFSLMELIIAISILVVFAAFAIPSYINITRDARTSRDTTKLISICNAFKTSMSDQEVIARMSEYDESIQIVVNCPIDNEGCIDLKNSDVIGVLDTGVCESRKLSKIAIWDNMYQSIGSEHSFEQKEIFNKNIVFTLTLKTATSTANCEYRIQDNPGSLS